MALQDQVLELMIKYSVELYELLNNKKIKTDIFYSILDQENKNKLLELIDKNKIKVSKKIDTKEYTKRDCLEEIIFITDTRYKHLKEIKDIVNINNIVKTTVTNKIHNKKIRINYFNKILDLILDDFYDKDQIQVIVKYKHLLADYDYQVNKEIMKNIDEYYIKKITI